MRGATRFTGPDSGMNGLACVGSLSGDCTSVERVLPALSISAGRGLRDAALEFVWRDADNTSSLGFRLGDVDVDGAARPVDD